MAKLSKDILDDIAAQNAIQSIDDAKELQAFIKGEQRDSLLDLAAFRINALKQGPGSGVQGSEKPKLGEQAEPFTKPVADFKEGIQGTKALAPENPQSEIRNPKSYVTIEDVLAAQRKAGRKI